MNPIVKKHQRLHRMAWAFLYLCGLSIPAMRAQTLTTILSFSGSNGASPGARLLQATNGSYYGTTENGGIGAGSVFRMSPGGVLTTLYSFCALDTCADGQSPFAALTEGSDGALYGTTVEGGILNGGTVFRISRDGGFAILSSLCTDSGCAAGIGPYGSLVQSKDGDFYGTTFFGGAYGYGTVFKITPTGTLSALYSFCAESGCPDGEHPRAGLVESADGIFYGTTHGNVGENNGSGTIFRITSDGALTTLYSFCSQTGCRDGLFPDAGLILAANGDLYGTTSQGGNATNSGTIFKFSAAAGLTTLHRFCSQPGCPDGADPLVAALVQGTDGNLYGTTESGGFENASGTIFKITPTGRLTTLYSFCRESGCPDGASPESGLIQSTNGAFYGTTLGGGATGDGTVFSLSVGLGPFVEPPAMSGAAGARVNPE